MKEVVLHYMNRESDVFASFLDATKAFDRVRFNCLFEALVERKVKWPDLRMLLDLYCNQRVRTSWGACSSAQFKVSNGIRQGSIISPILFSVYVDPLIEELRKCGAGCWMGHAYYGAMIYADDITLLSPSVAGLRQMISVCEKFCERRGIMFNALKSVCMRFSPAKNRVEPVVELGGVPMKWAKSVKHLGNIVSSNLSEANEIEYKRGDLFGRVNSLLGNFSGMSRRVRARIFNAQCCHLYGSQCWRLDDRSIERMSTAINRSIRRVLNLPP